MLSATTAFAADSPAAAPGARNYSPYPARTFADRAYFGGTHLHTTYSTDAGMIGCTLGPDEAYRFARGEQVTSSPGLQVQLQRPLDFLIVAEHAENLGLAPAIAESSPQLLKSDWGRTVHGYVKEGTVEGKGRARLATRGCDARTPSTTR